MIIGFLHRKYMDAALTTATIKGCKAPGHRVNKPITVKQTPATYFCH